MTSFALRHRVFVMTLAVMAMVYGTVTFLTMSRREDPEMTIRTAVVSCRWPGAPALKVDELVVDVLESAIRRVDEVEEIRSESLAGSAVIKVELTKFVSEIDQIWDELRNEVSAAQGELPAGAGVPFVNTSFGDVSPVVLAMYQTAAGARGDSITRPYSDRELEVFAELVEDELESLDSVSGANVYGLADERIYLEISAADWAKLGLTPAELQAALNDRNIVEASGEFETEGGRFLLRASGEFESLESFGGIVVGTDPEGHPILLRDLPFRIRRGLQEPISERVRFIDHDHRVARSAMIGVEMKAGSNVVKMGAAIQKRIAELRSSQLPPDLEFTIVNDLPRQVDNLVLNFVDNLWQAILVVLFVAFLMMGWRPAVVMAAAVPLCMIAAMGVVTLFGVELEQFSIASLIIALGMIVDNAIVVSDQTASLLKEGETRFRAALRGASELAVPILTSTLTTVAAFLPLLTIPGNTGEYIRSLPIVVSTTLIASYFVAMTVTPIFCFWILRAPKASKKAKKEGMGLRLYGRLIRGCLRAKGLTLGLAMAAVVGALALTPLIGSQFFPGGVRDQFFVHVRLPFGSTIAQTAEVVSQIEDAVLATSEVEVEGERVRRLRNAFTFVGSGGPRLMLTMDPKDPSPRYAFMVINTSSAELSGAWAEELHERVSQIPGARIDVRKYALGPPLDFPVEYRISGPDPERLLAAGEEMVTRLRQVPGVREPYHNWGNSTIQVDVEISPEKVQLAGLSNRAIAQSLNGLLSGYPLTDFRQGDYTVPVVLRLDAEERRDLRTLEQLYVGAGAAKVPLDTVAETRTSWQPAAIARFNRRRAIVAGAQVEDDYLATAVSAAARPAMEEVLDTLPVGYQVEELGEQKETVESQGDMGSALLVSMALILLVLIAQYNSIAKPLVVLSAVPLALIGALLGLLVTGWPLGFMPMLGIVSLAGVVINNAIILIDFIQGAVGQGVQLRDAVEQAGKARMQPIVLTTLTTVGGMIPLALFGGPMWAGMSFAMIFGLLFSTVLTLVVVPTIYVAFSEWFGMKVVVEEPS
ncbi:MAG: efflux RND transporter permease subunit [Planctomycetota bacterium]